MRKILISLMIIGMSCSCGSGLNIAKKEVMPIENIFKSAISNRSYLTEGKKSASANPQALLDIFELGHVNTDTVELYFKNQSLVLSFKQHNKTRTKIFEGKFRKGIYEIYLRKVKTEIPPLIPFLYSKRDIYRIRIGLTEDSNLIIDVKSARDGSIFLLAAGSSGRHQSFHENLQDKSIP